VNPVSGLLRAVDGVQQRTAPLAFVVGVIRKFGDDRCGSLAALLTYYGFLSLFPLLLLLLTVVGMASGGDPATVHRIEHSALSEFPVVGEQLGANIHELHNRAGVGLAIGIAGLVWGSQGAMQAAQYAMAEVWNVPNTERPGFGARLLRTLGTMALLGVLLVVSAGIAGVVTVGNRPGLETVGSIALSLVLNVTIGAVAFRLLTPQQISWRWQVPGAVVGGVGWTLLQYLGGALVGHTLRHTSQVYGFFAVVLGLLAWIYLNAQLTMFAAEINVVKARHLWPRSLVPPPLTVADKKVLADITLESTTRPEQKVEVTFDEEHLGAQGPNPGRPASWIGTGDHSGRPSEESQQRSLQS
jgi:YihY family inner membrane protein